MQTRSPRTILAASAALALAVAALAPNAAFAKGPGPGPGSCDADCPNEQPQSQQQIRARDGSAQSIQTRAGAAGGQLSRARAGAGPDRRSQARAGAAVKAQGRARAADNAPAGNGPAWRGQSDDRPRGPGACEECQFEMGTLTDEQVAQLVFMANEEKLAHDVYTALADLYAMPVFENIAAAEAQHLAAVEVVLVRYGVEDATTELPLGEFTDDTIAGLYAELLEQGSQSLDEAIAVGVFIEEDDIAALEGAMAGLEESAPDVHNMYSNLLAGSQRHLEAFGRFG